MVEDNNSATMMNMIIMMKVNILRAGSHDDNGLSQ